MHDMGPQPKEAGASRSIRQALELHEPAQCSAAALFVLKGWQFSAKISYIHNDSCDFRHFRI
jgi:hypothetical protein